MIQYGGRGFNIHDQNGEAIDPSDLEKEWKTTRVTGIYGPTSIIIECAGNYHHHKKQMMPIFGILHHSLLT